MDMLGDPTDKESQAMQEARFDALKKLRQQSKDLNIQNTLELSLYLILEVIQWLSTSR